MEKKIVSLMALSLTLCLAACGTEPEDEVEIANPASVYCEDNGGTLIMEDSEDGETGYCLFEDGTSCEEWAYYRGECGVAEVDEEAEEAVVADEEAVVADEEVVVADEEAVVADEEAVAE